MSKKILAEWIRENWWQVGLMTLGIALLIIGVVAAQTQTKGEELVVTAPLVTPTAMPVKKVVIDVAGAVMNPGVYQLDQGSRVSAALIAAGGLSGDADRTFVAKNINQAAMIRDGMKLYIPMVNESMSIYESGSEVESQSVNDLGGIISINSASESELDKLWGVGQARAKTIIDNRPYNDLSELVTKAKLPQDIIDNNSGNIGL